MTASYGAGVKLLLTQLLLALNTNTARANHTHPCFPTSCREETGLEIVISYFGPNRRALTLLSLGRVKGPSLVVRFG